MYYTNSDIFTAFLQVQIIFISVLLHEFGHSIAAWYFGIRTKFIMLFILGGVANLERETTTAKEEFWITLCGPLVNFVIFIVFAIIASISSNTSDSIDIFQFTMMVNLLMLVFNLLPAWPMDGGRLLRSTIAFFIDFDKSTIISTYISQGLCLLMCILGIYSQSFNLVFISFFIFFGAHSERKSAKSRIASKKLTHILLKMKNTLSEAEFITFRENFINSLNGDDIKDDANKVFDSIE